MSRHASHQSDRHGLMELTGALCNGTIDCDQLSLLERRLLESADARAVYLRYLNLHASLRRCSVMEQGKGVRYILPERPEGCFAQNVPDTFSLFRWTRDYFSQPGPLSILAATIFMVCLISILSILPAPTYERSRFNHVCTTSTSGTGLRPVDKDKKLKFVARITGKHDCRWSKDYLPPLRYAHLGLGRELKLDAGLLEITYYNGAKLVLEGPIEFTVEKPNACRLDVGKLAAKVPKPAVGFTVETPNLTVVDLGTEFGVQVDKDVGDQVHVFAGEIEAAQTIGGIRRKIRLGKGQSVRFDAATGKISRLEAGDYQFVRSISPKNHVPIRVAVVHFGRLEIFHGPDDLDLSGDIAWALNVGGVSDQTVRDVTFLSNANGRSAGATLSASTISCDPWGTRPEYGNTTDDDALEAVMHSSFYDMTSAAVIGLPVSPGRYKVQLLFSENYWAGGNAANRRGQAIQIEGEPAVKNLILPYEQGSAKPDITSGVVYTHTLSITDGRLDIVLPYQGKGVHRLFYDGNPILNGLTVERISDPPSPSQRSATQPSFPN